MRSIVVLIFFVSCANCYKILGVFPCPSKSHYHLGHALMKGLADDGHEVTIVSPYSQKQPIKNYKEILLENSVAEFEKYFSRENFVDFEGTYFWKFLFSSLDYAEAQTQWTFQSQNFRNLIQSDAQFDVIIVELIHGESLLGLGHRFNAPVIVSTAFAALKITTDLVATPNFASYIPHTVNGYTDRMNFWQRMYNSLSFWFEDIVVPLIAIPSEQKLYEELFPNAKNMPTIEEMRRNVSLVLLNTHVTFGTPRPYAPNMIEVGGLHIKQTIEPLPQNIQKFLDEAKNGAIYFSLGTNLKFSKVTKEQKNAIAGAFKEYPNIRILIKSDESIVIPSHKSSDVLIAPWFPQESVLAHPNVKVFVSHGGLLSTMETVHYGKPVIGISLAFDQKINMVLAEQKGYGISVPFTELSEEKLKTALRNMFSNPSYAENAKIVSDRYRDQLRTPLETAIHWVKHVAKNKGAPHLRMVAVDLPFYTLYNLDVWAFIIFLMLATLVILKRMTKRLLNLISSSDKTKPKTA